jgi:sporulation protein YlmC with PRC-barrel domain
MIAQADLQYLNGADVYAPDGRKIGSAGRVYLDARTGEPEWISVRTGLSGTKEAFVPLAQATLAGDRIEVPFDKVRIEDAPRIDAGGDLGPADEDRLCTYYGLGPAGTRTDQLGTARLRKYLVNEQSPASVPVNHQIDGDSAPRRRR